MNNNNNNKSLGELGLTSTKPNSNNNIYISGTIMAALFKNFHIYGNNTHGLLFGSINYNLWDVHSDEISTSVKTEQIIVINSFEILKGNSLESSNIVNPFEDEENQKSELSQILEKNKDQQLLGYFRFRSNSTMKPSLKEIFNIFYIKNNLKVNNLENIPILGIFNLTANKFHTTYKYEYCFYSHTETKGFEKIPIIITNMVESAHEKYKNFITTAPTNNISSMNKFQSVFDITANKECVKQQEILFNNISELMKTSLTEIEKNRKIKEDLEKEIEDLEKIKPEKILF
ncbi:hypothetical protein BCR32DRAFT_268593 [Anaeromyces robustus]|uniref:Uncharacterized protein n=1 Tax=Anaeromyces robustus TaxID=1754192 RepID=A0A1Y1X574_9FUNG|nr:hypothetical protein BCR32DRAFT_268593 [Anaeromyces robustus]|eukprot:ORX80933.1 hypothetical protein BCR32DRAFT_268593 [Anaeromyces robustus]